MQNNELAIVSSAEQLPVLASSREIAFPLWNVLKNTTFPGASDEMVALAYDYCKSRGLDVLKKPIHIVPTYDSKTRTMKESIWPGIGELRTTAMRTNCYAGKDETKFGPELNKDFKGSVKRDGGWEDITLNLSYPEWAQVTVYRIIQGTRYAFPGPKVMWEELYSSQGRSGVPNSQWLKRPWGQIEKCAEAAALRIAFPEEIGSDFIADEIHTTEVIDVTETLAEQAAKGATGQISDGAQPPTRRRGRAPKGLNAAAVSPAVEGVAEVEATAARTEPLSETTKPEEPATPVPEAQKPKSLGDKETQTANVTIISATATTLPVKRKEGEKICDRVLKVETIGDFNGFCYQFVPENEKPNELFQNAANLSLDLVGRAVQGGSIKVFITAVKSLAEPTAVTTDEF